MGYEIALGKRVVGVVNPDNTVSYDLESIREEIKEMIAGQSGSSGFFTTAKVIYRWDRNRKTNNDNLILFFDKFLNYYLFFS